MDPNIKLDNPEGISEEQGGVEMATHGYANLIGWHMYLAIATHPNIAKTKALDSSEKDI